MNKRLLEIWKRKPKAETHWEYGGGYYHQMDMDFWLKEIELEIERLTEHEGGNITEGEDWIAKPHSSEQSPSSTGSE